jgi:hypothetical protein
MATADLPDAVGPRRTGTVIRASSLAMEIIREYALAGVGSHRYFY